MGRIHDKGRLTGFIIVEMIDGCAHIEQVSVLPTDQGQGVGRALIERVEQWAILHRLAALILITFVHIPWNRPLYEHLGFRVLSQDEITPRYPANPHH